MKFICVFCGSNNEAAKKYEALARQLGKEIVANGYGLVYGGGNVGLMKILADSVLEAEGEVIGVITPEVRALNVVHAGIKQENLFEEATYSARKAKMAQLSDGFIALPGGLGTLDELTEVAINNQFASYANTSANPVKPCVVFNINGFYNGSLQQLKRCAAEGWITQKHFNMLYFTEVPQFAVKHIKEFKAAEADNSRWWEKSKTEQEVDNIFQKIKSNKNILNEEDFKEQLTHWLVLFCDVAKVEMDKAIKYLLECSSLENAHSNLSTFGNGLIAKLNADLLNTHLKAHNYVNGLKLV